MKTKYIILLLIFIDLTPLSAQSWLEQGDAYAAEEDYASAARMYSQCMKINNNCAFALFNLIYKGKIESQYTNELFDILLPIAKLNDPVAANNIGILYYDGIGVEKNEQEAYKWLNKSALNKCKIAHFNIKDLFEFQEGFCCINHQEKYGFINSNGDMVIKPQFDDASCFSEGLAYVEKNGKYGYIDKTGKLVIPYKFDDANDFSEGLAVVEIDEEYGYIDKSGKLVIPCKYDYAFDFSEDLARVKKDDKIGFINKSGKLIIPVKFDNANDFSEGLAKVEKDGKYGYIDKNGKIAIPMASFPCGDFHEGLAAYCLNGKWGFIDKKGSYVIDFRYEHVGDFHEGLAWVKCGKNENNKYRYIDTTGKPMICYPACLDGVSDFEKGKALVKQNESKFYVNKKGETIEFYESPD